MTRADRRIYLIFFVLGAIFLTSMLVRPFPLTDGLKIILLAWQQLLFIVGGFIGSSKEIFKMPQQKCWGRGILYGLGLWITNTVLGVMSLSIARLLFSSDTVQHMVLKERLAIEGLVRSDNPLVVVAIMFLLVFGAPVSEEFFFRGLLTGFLNEKIGAAKAVFFSALLFAVLHFYILQFLPVLVAGILLGRIFIRTENIFIPILAHSLVNSIALVVLLSSL